MEEASLQDLINDVAKLSKNKGIQITTYISGRSEVAYFPVHENSRLTTVKGPSIKFVLQKILADYHLYLEAVST